MSATVDPVGAAPETRSLHFGALLFGAAVAPIFWIGQLMLGYGVTAHRCYPGDHPAPLASAAALHMALIGFDVVALLACIAGGLVSHLCWRQAQGSVTASHVLHTGEDRDRFLAMWGLLSSLWFFGAILFNTIASLTVPPCLT